MNTTIPDFTDAEQKLVPVSLFERYGKLVPMQLADSELQLDELSDELTLPLPILLFRDGTIRHRP